MTNSWLVALKEYNKNKNKWCIPKKGSKEYNQVRKIMDDMDTKEKKVKEKKVKEKKVKELDDDEMDVVNKYSELWWKGELANTATLINKKTGIEYDATIKKILPKEKKVEFNLYREFISQKPVNKNVKINMNNKNSLYEYVMQ